jgi:hypothetical protein
MILDRSRLVNLKNYAFFEHVEELKLRKNEVNVFTEGLILEGKMPIINYGSH